MEKLDILKRSLAAGVTAIIHSSGGRKVIRLCTTNHEVLSQAGELPKDIRYYGDAKKDPSKDFIRLYDISAYGWRTLKLHDILWCTGMDLGILLESVDI